MGTGNFLLAESLRTVSAGRFDAANASYMADLIKSVVANNVEDSRTQAVKVYELIERFLWDFKLIKSKPEGLEFCFQVIARSACGSGTEEAADSQLVNRPRLERPVVLGDLIRSKFDKMLEKPEPSSMPDNLGDGQGENGQGEMGGVEAGFNDPFLGLEKVKANFNQFIPIDESVKIMKAAAKKREKQIRMMKQWEQSKQPLPPPQRKHGDTQLKKMTDIIVPKFSVSVAGRELLKDANLRIVVGHIYGLIGRNGIGKTTFISAMARGEIAGIEPELNIGCVEQECGDYLNVTPLECVLGVDEERTSLLREETALNEEEELSPAKSARLQWVHTRLVEIEAGKAEPEACQILDGLGLSVDMYTNKKIKELSGGWRMRVMLARVLFADPDLLCLDEPTNHLDLHAVAWLTQYLKQSNKTCLLVSHARQFLNDVCGDIMEFKDRQLKYYSGDYDTYERVKADRELASKREAEQQTAKRAHMQTFIDKFRYKAKSAALVQSRIKQLAKLPMLESITEDPSLHFKFGVPSELPNPMLVMQDVHFTWDAKKPQETLDKSKCILQGVDFSADMNTRAAICGVNGSGKSTFLKLLIGQIEPVEGFTFRHNRLKIGYFAQHHVDGLDLTKNAVQQLQTRYPDSKLSDEAARTFLSRFGISGLMALEPLFILSGGQKSRVAIAVMAFENPHILVLDEPTNHLDLDAVQALVVALLSCVIEDVFHMNPLSRRLEKFKGNFEEYKAQLLRKKL